MKIILKNNRYGKCDKKEEENVVRRDERSLSTHTEHTHTQKGKKFLKYVSTRKRYLYQIRKGKNSYSNINRGLKKFKCNWHYELNVIKLRN